MHVYCTNCVIIHVLQCVLHCKDYLPMKIPDDVYIVLKVKADRKQNKLARFQERFLTRFKSIAFDCYSNLSKNRGVPPSCNAILISDLTVFSTFSNNNVF